MTVERCPCCKQMIQGKNPPKPARHCYDCGKPIPRGDRYTYQEREGMTTLVHRVCGNPTSYFPARECNKIGVVGYKRMSAEELDQADANEAEIERIALEWRQSVGRFRPGDPSPSL